MKIIESVQTFIQECPLIPEFSRLCVDYLPDGINTYSVEEVPAQAITRAYIDGSTERQFLFVFASRLFYSEELRNNIDNSGFFEDFAEWLEEQTDKDNLPELEAGKTATKIEAISSGYLFDVSGDLSNARYQIQCRLTYDQEKGG